MRKKLIVVVFSLTPLAMLAAAARKIDVVAQIPLVAQVDSPAEADLAPGETRLITVRVACNQPWLVDVQAENPQITASARHVGSAGGMAAAGHTFTLALTCSPTAPGVQHTTLASRLVSGPLVAGLRR